MLRQTDENVNAVSSSLDMSSVKMELVPVKTKCLLSCMQASRRMLKCAACWE